MKLGVTFKESKAKIQKTRYKNKLISFKDKGLGLGCCTELKRCEYYESILCGCGERMHRNV